MKTEVSLNKKDLIKSAKVIFELNENNSLKTVSAKTDDLGWTHHRVQQQYNGIPLDGATYILHEKNGIIKKANGYLQPNFIASQTSAKLSKEEALELLLANINAKKYAWEDERHEELIKRQKKNDEFSFYPTPELVYHKPDFHNEKSKFILCYKIDVFSVEPFERHWYYVDAQSGEILDKLPRIHSNSCNHGKGLTNYYGEVDIVTFKESNKYYLRNICNSGQDGIYTYNDQYTAQTPYTEFEDVDNNWNENWLKTAVEAHWGAQYAYEYFLNEHNLNSFDGEGAEILSWVHFDIDKFYAGWTGNYMLFSDGGPGNNPLTCLDVVAHEYTHAVISRSSNLHYWDESGALNESFADIFGTVVEMLYAPNEKDWYIAEDSYINGGALRNMSNPKDKGQPDTYNGDKWQATYGVYGDGVHTNSGVQNYWFYLLVEGGSGINDNGVPYNVQGLGSGINNLKKAAKIAYRNLSYY